MRRTEEANSGAVGGGNLTVLRGQLEQANEAYLRALNLGTFRNRRTYLNRDAYEVGGDYGQQVGLVAGSGKVKGRLTYAG